MNPNHQTSSRLISSNIVHQEAIDPVHDSVQYVEVPVYQEVVTKVPRVEYIDRIKYVPVVHTEYIDKYVEVPKIEIVDKIVEVPVYEDVVRHVPVIKIVEVEKPVFRYVNRVEVKIVEKIQEVPGPLVEVEKPYTVENKIIVPRYTDVEVPTVVAQKMQPVVTESDTEQMEVTVKEYDPYLVPVEVYIPKPVERRLIAQETTQEHRVVDIPPSHFNSLIKILNPKLIDRDVDGLYFKSLDGGVPMLGTGVSIVRPLSDDWRRTHTEGRVRVTASGVMQQPRLFLGTQHSVSS